MGNEHDHAHEHEHGYHVDGHLHGGDDHSDNIMKHDHCDRDHNPDASFKSRHEAELDARAGARTDAEYAEAMANQRKLKRATAFVLVFFFVEIVGGLWSGSLAIISDAAHLLTDVSGFILTMIANEIATRPACDKFTYGPVRAEVLSALFSTVTILVISLLLVYFAILRLVDFSRGRGEEIDGKMMSFIAALGLLVNMALLRVLGHDHEGHHHGHDHSHAHSHGGHDEHVHDEHEHDESEHGHEYHEEDAGLMEREGTTHGVAGEHSVLVQNPSLNNVGGRAAVAFAEEGSFGSGTRGKHHDRYGSLDLDVLEDGVVEETSRKPRKAKNKKNINMEAATLHAVTDLIQSVGALIAGLLIWWDSRLKWADPIATLVFVGLVINSTGWLLQRATNVLLEGVPDNMDYERLRTRLSAITGVTDVHCLHVWSLTMGRTVVSAHIKATVPESALSAAHEICEDMGVTHSTIQVQVDHCMPASCTHRCVSAVGRCCDPDSRNPSPRSTSSDAAATADREPQTSSALASG